MLSALDHSPQGHEAHPRWPQSVTLKGFLAWGRMVFSLRCGSLLCGSSTSTYLNTKHQRWSDLETQCWRTPTQGCPASSMWGLTQYPRSTTQGLPVPPSVRGPQYSETGLVTTHTCDLVSLLGDLCSLPWAHPRREDCSPQGTVYFQMTVLLYLQLHRQAGCHLQTTLSFVLWSPVLESGDSKPFQSCCTATMWYRVAGKAFRSIQHPQAQRPREKAFQHLLPKVEVFSMNHGHRKHDGWGPWDPTFQCGAQAPRLNPGSLSAHVSGAE